MVVLSDSGKLDESETLLHDGDNVVVIGAGNVAMDAARTAIRRGAENVTIVYHKTEAEIFQLPSEYEAAVKEERTIQFSEAAHRLSEQKADACFKQYPPQTGRI